MVRLMDELPESFDILTNIGQQFNMQMCQLDPIYDFKPVNLELLLMSRLSFSLKRNGILKYMKYITDRNIDIYT
jgi:hypothetical protein